MLNWWMTLDLKGKMRFWSLLGIAINGGLFLVGMWIPKVFFASCFVLLLTLLMKSDSAEDI